MDPERLQAALRATFVRELEDHVRSLTADLLALERTQGDGERQELLARLFRNVHSVKGSSRAAAVDLIEAAAARMEAILSGLRDGAPSAGAGASGAADASAPAGSGPIDLLLEAVDAIDEAGQRLREARALEGGRLSALVPRLGGAPSPVRTPPAAASAPAPAAAGLGAPAAVRLEAAQLDRLRAVDVELRAARVGVQALPGALEALQDEVRRADAEAEREALQLLRLAGGIPAARELLGRQRARQRRLAAELERLRAGAAGAARRLAAAAGEVAREVSGLRLVPVADAFAGLERAARDLARDEGKALDVVLDAGDVALDRAIVDALRAPLLHLVRNAVDHGLEPPGEREAAGKPPRGRITVSARLAGGEVEIAVADDGRGLDLEAIRERAIRAGLEPPREPHALLRLVFLPGFTTARQVTDVSGRGVGLDAVRAAVERLQGGVDLQSTPGHGARFVLSVPLTLVAVRALIVSAGGERLAIPATHLRRLVAARPDELRPMGGRDTLALDGAALPLASLAGSLGLPAQPLPPGAPVHAVVVSSGGRRVALAVDAIHAECELQMRGLGRRVRRLRHLAGAAVLPDGGLVLVLQVPAVVETALGGGAPVTLPRTPPAPRRRRVLLVDDSPTTRQLERAILEGAGYEVVTAADGEEAWQVLERDGADALVADVEMPRLDGIALTARVRGSGALAALPVVLVTARETEADRRRGLAAGASAYLVKSTFDQRSLLETLDAFLG